MKPFDYIAARHWIAFLFALLLSVLPLHANPIEVPERPNNAEAIGLVVAAIGLEIACVAFLLRKSRKPRLFVLWLLGMHLITFPGFLCFLWSLDQMRPVFSVILAEGLVVIVEAAFIYLICRFAPSAKPDVPIPVFSKCLLSSFVGNVCSAAVFPVLLAAYDAIFQG